MSLINDALKRAKESQRSNPPSGARPLPPVESAARGGTGWILAVATVLFLAAVCLVIGPSLFGHKAPPVAAAGTSKIPAPLPAATAPVPAPIPAPAPPPVEVPSAPAATSNALPLPVTPVEQLPRLQGVLFSTTRPLAIVDGKTVNVGDRVGDFR